MSEKRFGKISARQKCETNRQKIQAVLEERKMGAFQLARIRYGKIWIFNYLLFIGLAILVILLAFTFKSSLRFEISIAGLLVYVFLLRFNHKRRIHKDDHPDEEKFEAATFAMGTASKIGIVYAMVATIVACFVSP